MPRKLFGHEQRVLTDRSTECRCQRILTYFVVFKDCSDPSSAHNHDAVGDRKEFLCVRRANQYGKTFCPQSS